MKDIFNTISYFLIPFAHKVIPQYNRKMKRQGWRLILYALWFTPIVPLILLLKTFRLRRPLFSWLLLGAIAWGLVDFLILTRPLQWEWLALLQVLWSLAGGLGCAFVAEIAANNHWFSEPPTSPNIAPPLSLSWPTILGCGFLIYCVLLTDITVVWLIYKTLEHSIGETLNPLLLLWALPGLGLGVILAVLWQRRLGTLTTAVLANCFIGIHLLLIGAALLLTLLVMVYLMILVPETVRLDQSESTLITMTWILQLIPMIAYSYYLGLSPRISHLVVRVLICLGLFLLNFTQIALISGDQGLLYRYWAIREQGNENPIKQEQVVRNWQRYLSVFPETNEQAQVLWRMATLLVRLNHHEQALNLYRRLSRLPDNVQGQYYIRQARTLLQHAQGNFDQKPVLLESVPVISHAEYLDNSWRSVLSFLRSARTDLSQEEFMITLRALSLSQEHLQLPPITHLFEVKAYSRLLGVEVMLQSASLDEIKTILRSGKPILFRWQDEWVSLVGFDPRYGTFLYYEYSLETDELRKRHKESQAKTVLFHSEREDQRQLHRLQNSLLEQVIEEDVIQALNDHHWLIATLGSSANDVQKEKEVESRSAGWDAFLLGELAFQAGDPIVSLDFYALCVKKLPQATWVLPYVHMARLTIEHPSRDILENRLPLRMQALTTAFTQWKQNREHKSLLAKAKTAFEQQELQSLPTPILERLGNLLEPNDPQDRPRLIEYYQILCQRYPEHLPYLTALAEVYRQQGRLEPLVEVYRRISLLEPQQPAHQLRLAEVLLDLGRASEAEVLLRNMRRKNGEYRGRYLALSGRTQRQMGRHSQAVRLLQEALQENLADPELRAELAMALDELGRHQKALVEWNWVELSSVNPTHLALARQRLGLTVENR